MFIAKDDHYRTFIIISKASRMATIMTDRQHVQNAGYQSVELLSISNELLNPVVVPMIRT